MKLKNFLRHPVGIRITAWVLSAYIRFVFWTNRWQKVGEEHTQKYLKGAPLVACFWHNRLMMMTFAWTGPEGILHMLISGHSDGKLISQTVAHHGVQTIVGSSSKGGANALRRILKVLKAKKIIGITPDGPRGPRFKADEGVVNIARLAGLEVLPAAYSTSRRIVLGSWDRFIVALPFGRGAFVFGEPIKIPRDLDERGVETYRQRVEEKLMAVSDEADRLCGHAPFDRNVASSKKGD